MKYCLLILIGLTFAACKKEFASPTIKQAYESVMAVHDEVMPELSTIHKLKKKIRKLDTKGPEALDLIKRLDAADDGMMDWMSDFKLDGKADLVIQEKYLADEQIKINKVSADMKSSMQAAQNFLNKQK